MDYEFGQIDVVTGTVASGAGGNISITLRPPANCIYVAKTIMSYQDDAARTYTITITDGTDTFNYTNGTSYGANVNVLPLKELSLNNLILTYNAYLIITWNSVAGAKNIYIQSLVHKFTGLWGYKLEV